MDDSDASDISFSYSKRRGGKRPCESAALISEDDSDCDLIARTPSPSSDSVVVPPSEPEDSSSEEGNEIQSDSDTSNKSNEMDKPNKTPVSTRKVHPNLARITHMSGVGTDSDSLYLSADENENDEESGATGNEEKDKNSEKLVVFDDVLHDSDTISSGSTSEDVEKSPAVKHDDAGLSPCSTPPSVDSKEPSNRNAVGKSGFNSSITEWGEDLKSTLGQVIHISDLEDVEENGETYHLNETMRQSGGQVIHTSDMEAEENDESDLDEARSVVDLTQSDSSLQNSPVGAIRQDIPQQRSVADIVSELSAVSNEVMVKEGLLSNVRLDTLPDNGVQLKATLGLSKKRQAELEKELNNNDEFMSQKDGLNQYQKGGASYQLPTSVKDEPRVKLEYKDKDAGPSNRNLLPTGIKDKPRVKLEHAEYFLDAEADSDSSYHDDFDEEDDIDESKMPDWGDLPQPDMTISGLGKRALTTHLTQKSLTVDALSKLHQALKTCPSEETQEEDPKLLRVELMPHQKHGLAWMLWREREIPSGGILADDMGLGKTLSMISLILKDTENKENSDDSRDSDSEDDSPGWRSSKYPRMPKGGTLVVCPASLLAQWEREIYKRVKRRALTVELYHGAKRETKPRRLANNDVVITTYNLVSRESGVETPKNCTKVKSKGPLFLIKWERIILDEAHVVRNYKSQMAMGVCELIGKHRWCLTGTPIHNKELDLYALLKFLQCSPFDDLKVWKQWVDNKHAAGMQRLNTMMKSLMLRRTKEQLLGKGELNCLPEKSVEQIAVHLDPEELEIYEKVALFSKTLFAQFLYQRSEKQQLLDARYGFSTKPIWEQGDAPDNQFTTTEELAMMHRKMKGLADVKAHEILVLLLRLRQICCHPWLVKKMVEDGDLDIGGGGVEDTDGVDVDLFNKMNNLNINESNIDDEAEDRLNSSGIVSTDHPALNRDRASAKIRAILDLIQDRFLDSDDKGIIVSQWTSMLEIIASFLKDMHVKFETLSGKVPVDKRQDIVSEFNKSSSGPQILLLSLTAGGVGLNLVGANHLLLVDLHWNPQLEAQASDRIYRVGQKKKVFIYKFVTSDTIEERIKQLQERKLALADNVLTGTRNTQASKLTLDDLKMLFSSGPMPTQSNPLPSTSKN